MSQVCFFDAYGTLFDVHAAVRRHADALGPEADRVSALWRAKQLEYSWVHTLSERYVDFQTLTTMALDFALEAMPTANRAVRDDLLQAYMTLDAYDEVAPVLQQLRQRRATTGILSNGSRLMLDAAVEHAGLGDLLDHVLSVDDVRSFKTRAETYRMVCDAAGCEPGDVTFLSSNRWDVAGATWFGFRCVWVNRSEQPDEYADGAPVRVVRDLREALASI